MSVSPLPENDQMMRAAYAAFISPSLVALPALLRPGADAGLVGHQVGE